MACRRAAITWPSLARDKTQLGAEALQMRSTDGGGHGGGEMPWAAAGGASLGHGGGGGTDTPCGHGSTPAARGEWRAAGSEPGGEVH